MEKPDRAPFGAVLREFRLARGLSQEELAARCHMSIDGISALERGKRQAPQRQTLALLTAGLELSAAERLRILAAAAPQRPQLRRVSRTPGPAKEDRHNLPFPLTRFMGRERESATLRAFLAEHRLVTLTGVGGVGKTRLAIETAHGEIDHFADGVWLVQFAPLADAAAVAARVASILGVPQRFATNDSWIGEIKNKALLIVFDNCEHVLKATATVAQQVLEQCPNIRILATSRERLKVTGERVYQLKSLELPRARSQLPSSIDNLRRSPAVAMFVDRARDADPNFAIDEADPAAWRTLQVVCARLDGIPLAIELAAGQTNAMSLDMLARALDRRFDLLARGARTALPRHQTLRALHDWSYDLLDERERCVFRRLAVFAGGWTLDAAAYVCADAAIEPDLVVTLMFSLIEKSLVSADVAGKASRYAMLETTRAYATEQLRQSAEYDTIAHRHAQHYLRFIVQANASWGRPSPAGWLRPLELELDNLRSALRWSLDGHDAVLAAGIAKAQHTVLELLSLFGEGADWCERALAALGAEPEPKLAAPLLVVLAKFYTRAGYAQRGLSSATRAVELYRRLVETGSANRTRAPLAIALGLVARNLAFLQRRQEADAYATEAVEIARDAVDGSAKAWTYYVKSLTVEATATQSRRELLTAAMEHARSLSESYLSGLILIGFGHAEFDARDFGRAREYAQEARRHFGQSEYDEDLAIGALSLSSMAAIAAGDFALAHADARQALQLSTAGQLDLSFALHVVANIAAMRDDVAQAARLIGAAEAHFAEMTALRFPFLQLLHQQTLAKIAAAGSRREIAAWAAQGRKFSLEDTIEAALGIRTADENTA